MFFGKRTLPLSNKYQFTLPANYREALSNAAFITQGFDRNLILLSKQAFDTIYSYIKSTSISDPLARLLSRLFLGSAVEIEIDDLGQVMLPKSLCEYAGLDKEITIVGQGEYSEIWSPVLWEKQMDGLNEVDANTDRFEKFHVALS